MRLYWERSNSHQSLQKIVIGKNIHSFEYDKEKQPRGGVAYDKAKETKALRILRFAASI